MSEMLDDILSLENISLAVAKVCSNKGAGGVDGMEWRKSMSIWRRNGQLPRS